jgi:hypothetical protein
MAVGAEVGGGADGCCAAVTTSGVAVTGGGVVTETSPRTPLADAEVADHR